MASQPSPLVRIVVPLLILSSGIVFFFAILRNAEQPEERRRAAEAERIAEREAESPSSESLIPDDVSTPETDSSQDSTPPPPDTGAPEPGADDQESGAQEPNQDQDPDQAQPAMEPVAGLYAEVFASEPLDPIGSIGPDGNPVTDDQWRMQIQFNRTGVGIDRLTLSDQFVDLQRTEHETLQQAVVIQQGGRPLALVPMAALVVTVNDQPIVLTTPEEGSFWRQVSPGVFEAFLLDGAGDRAARIERAFILTPHSYDVRLNQSFENLTDTPMTVSWTQEGPLELDKGAVTYGGDRRRTRFGFMEDPSRGGGQRVRTERYLYGRDRLVKNAATKPAAETIWPNTVSENNGDTLVWFGETNRYFGVTMHPLIDPTQRPVNKAFSLIDSVDRVLIQTGPGQRADDYTVGLRIHTPVQAVGPGETLDLSMGFLSGPVSSDIISKDPMLSALGMDELVIYTFGGPCAFCTFQWLTYPLRWFLGVLHSILFDWSLAIIVLVVCVRTVLHPVTRFSQTSMHRFGKQMQGLAPKQKKIQEKYRDDPKRMQEELRRLMREEGVNFAGALGCLPMFLQTPIWIALYAMIFFTFELRHEPAFFGLFQAISGGAWGFLGNLAEPDAFLSLGTSINVPLISGMMGPIESINVLPFLLGVVFFIHQKYMTPPTSATLSPEQQQAQTISRVLMVVLFPVIMYNAPSALSIYFVTNSTLAIFESRLIRKRADAEDERRKEEEAKNPTRGKKKKKTSASKKGWLERMTERAEQLQADREKIKKMEQRRAGGGGPGKGTKYQRRPKRK